MIAKKNSRLDLERKRTALFAMGLLTASSFVLAAFTYDSALTVEEEKQAQQSSNLDYFVNNLEKEDKVIDVKTKTDTKVDNQDDQQTEQTIDIQSEPNENIKKTENTDKTFDPSVGLKDLPYNFGNGMPVFDDLEEEIIDWVDEEAEFIGGYEEMMNYIISRIEYPEDAIEMDIQGKVLISFVVEKDGSISNVFVEKGVYKSLDREAKRVVRSFPKWKPAELSAKRLEREFDYQLYSHLQQIRNTIVLIAKKASRLASVLLR